jgi:hypothetical protein
VDIDECKDPKLHDCGGGDGTLCQNVIATSYNIDAEHVPYHCQCRAGQELAARSSLPNVRLESDRNTNRCKNAEVVLAAGKSSLSMQIKNFGPNQGKVLMAGRVVTPTSANPAPGTGLYTYIRDGLYPGREYLWTFTATHSQGTQTGDIDGVAARTWCGTQLAENERTNLVSKKSTGSPVNFKAKQLGGRIEFHWTDQSLCEDSFQVSRRQISMTQFANIECIKGHRTQKCHFYSAPVPYRMVLRDHCTDPAKCVRRTPDTTVENCVLSCTNADYDCETANFDVKNKICFHFFNYSDVYFIVDKDFLWQFIHKGKDPQFIQLPHTMDKDVLGNEVAVSNEFRVHLTEPSGALVNPGVMLADELR